MQSIPNSDPAKKQDSGPSSPAELDRALGEIEHTLDQMLILAQLSASDLNMDRDALQRTLERFQDKIDRIADLI